LVPQAFRSNPERPGQFYDETGLIGHFVSRAPSRLHRPCPDANDFFGWLFLAQHYGLPTRLLDWTESPLVAAYFAVLEHPNDDGCIWALWPNRFFDAANGLVQIRDPRVRKIAGSAFTGRRLPKVVPAMAIDGQEIDPRMQAQMSRFTLHSDHTSLEGGEPESPQWLVQFVIPKKAKETVRAQLSALGIRRSNLFPDLASLAAELRSMVGAL
jgi:hypothetical protein